MQYTRLMVQSTVLTLSIIAGCGSEPPTPREQIAAIISEIEAAAQERDALAIEAHISESYSDARGRDKSALSDLIRYQFLRGGRLYLISRIRSLDLPEPAIARLDLLAGWTRVKVSDLTELRGPDASIYAFDLDLREESDGAWRVTRAEWKRANADDLL